MGNGRRHADIGDHWLVCADIRRVGDRSGVLALNIRAEPCLMFTDDGGVAGSLYILIIVGRSSGGDADVWEKTIDYETLAHGL